MDGLSSFTAMSSSLSLSCVSGCLARAYSVQVNAVDDVSLPASICNDKHCEELDCGHWTHKGGDLSEYLVVRKLLVWPKIRRHVCADCSVSISDLTIGGWGRHSLSMESRSLPISSPFSSPLACDDWIAYLFSSIKRCQSVKRFLRGCG